jgi:polyhydroxybutyrate depolymerase
MARRRGSLVLGSVGAGVFAGAAALAIGTQACGTSSSGTPGGASSSAASTGATTGGASSGSGATGASSGGTGASSGATTSGGSSGASSVDASTGPASSGCGAAALPTPDSIPDAGGFGGSTLPLQRFKIVVGGVTREFILGLPSNYDAQHEYPVVFAWHGAGGTDVQVAWGGTSSFDVFGGFYGLRYLSNQNSKPMLFVSGQGLEGANDAGSGWPNTNGQDVAFTQAMVTWLESNYCVDQAHVFSVGMSYGGIMTNTVGCKMGDVFRAIAPMSGIGPGLGRGAAGCVGQVAAWVAHGSQDTTVPVEAGMASRDYWVQANHCSSTTTPIAPSPCIAYQGCDTGFPVDWCEFDGGHTVVSFEPPGIWSFLSQF